jgi:hypothetical protein
MVVSTTGLEAAPAGLKRLCLGFDAFVGGHNTKVEVRTERREVWSAPALVAWLAPVSTSGPAPFLVKAADEHGGGRMVALSVMGFAIAWTALLVLLLLVGYVVLTGPHHYRQGPSRAITKRRSS